MTSQDEIQNGSSKMLRTNPQLLSLLVCPQTRTPLIYDYAAAELISLQAACAYKITDAVPIMLTSHARPLSEEECRKWQSFSHRHS
jgi:uncharacterized protein YbaR (Trm112 family)